MGNVPQNHRHKRNGGRTERQAQSESVRSDLYSQRRDSSAKRGYGYKWQKASRLFLDANPLCVMCAKAGRTAGATVVDHIRPHKGNKESFWDIDNWQALCKPCHDSHKKSIEYHGFSNEIGNDGWPVDDAHPVNAHAKALEKRTKSGIKIKHLDNTE